MTIELLDYLESLTVEKVSDIFTRFCTLSEDERNQSDVFQNLFLLDNADLHAYLLELLTESLCSEEIQLANDFVAAVAQKSSFPDLLQSKSYITIWLQIRVYGPNCELECFDLHVMDSTFLGYAVSAHFPTLVTWAMDRGGNPNQSFSKSSGFSPFQLIIRELRRLVVQGKIHADMSSSLRATFNAIIHHPYYTPNEDTTTALRLVCALNDTQSVLKLTALCVQHKVPLSKSTIDVQRAINSENQLLITTLLSAGIHPLLLRCGDFSALQAAAKLVNQTLYETFIDAVLQQKPVGHSLISLQQSEYMKEPLFRKVPLSSYTVLTHSGSDDDTKQCVGAFAYLSLAVRIQNDSQQQVIIKRFSTSLDPSDPKRKTFWRAKAVALAEFKNELRILTDLHHDNIVMLHAIYFSVKPFRIGLILENAELGDMGRFVTANSNVSDSMKQSFARDIISAIRYLHDNSIIHLDIKPYNVLLFLNRDKTITAKLCDFNLSMKLKNHTGPLRVRSGTMLFLPHEVLLQKQINPKSAYAIDIYAFAMTLLFLVNLRESWNVFENVEAYFAALRQGARPQIDDSPSCKRPHSIANLIRHCWAEKPAERPTSQAVEEQLQQNTYCFKHSVP